VTDGTPAGSSELIVAGSNASGLFTNVIAPHLTVFAGKALFVGEDASGNISLWTTDGTGAGTSELAAAAGYHNGLFYNFAAPDFTALGAKVLFAGQDATGNPNLWVTDGTGFSDILWQKSSGEVDIWELNGANVIGSLGNPGPTWHTVSTGDFNGDGHSDIL
jgi:ELWxxDGT repeat protein